MNSHNSSYGEALRLGLGMQRGAYADNIFRMKELLIIPIVVKNQQKLESFKFLTIIFTQSGFGQHKNLID